MTLVLTLGETVGVVGIPTARIGSCVTWLPPLVGAGFAISRLRSRLTKPALITGLRVIDETLSPASGFSKTIILEG